MQALITRGWNRTNTRGMWGMLVVSLLMATTASPALAQRYRSHQPAMNEREARFLQRDVSSIFRNSGEFQTNREKIDEYFNKYYFLKMSQYSPDNLAELGSMRENLFKLFLRNNTSIEPAQEHLTGLVLNAMRTFARGTYHPAVRYNAVLVLGLLDQQYASGNQPPVPLPAAAEELLALLESEQLNDVAVPYALKVGALIGLERHARFGLSNQHAQRVTQAAMAMIEMEYPQDIEAAVVDWGRYAAARVLAQQEAPPADIQRILTQLINNDQLSLEDRCAVAYLMEDIDYTGAQGMDENASLLALGTLTQQVVDEEAKLATDFKEEMYEGAGGGGRGRTRGLYGDRGEGPSGPELSRRRLLTRLSYIRLGSLSLQAGLTDEAKARLDSLITPLEPVVNATADEDLHDLDIADAVIELEGTIDNVIAGWQAPAVEEGEAN